PPRAIPLDQVERSEEHLQKVLEELQKAVPDRQNRYLNESAKRPINQQALIALQYGLVRDALKVLESNLSKLDPDGLAMLIRLLISTGRGDEALGLIEQIRETLLRQPPESDPQRELERKQRLFQYQQFRIRALIVGGYFAKAGAELDETYPFYQQRRDAISTRVSLARAVGGLAFS